MHKDVYFVRTQAILARILHTANTQYRKFETYITIKGIASLSPYFHMHVSVSDLYSPTIGLPILLQENMCTDPGNI
jgi:hypothetical protein